jgi:hypothetical protein
LMVGFWADRGDEVRHRRGSARFGANDPSGRDQRSDGAPQCELGGPSTIRSGVRPQAPREMSPRLAGAMPESGADIWPAEPARTSGRPSRRGHLAGRVGRKHLRDGHRARTALPDSRQARAGARLRHGPPCQAADREQRCARATRLRRLRTRTFRKAPPLPLSRWLALSERSSPDSASVDGSKRRCREIGH